VIGNTCVQENADLDGKSDIEKRADTHLLTLPIPNPPILCQVLRPRIPTTTLSGRYRAMSRSRIVVIRPETYSRIMETYGDMGVRFERHNNRMVGHLSFTII
jgi:hypothetical protein